ncbi:MAG: recombinase RecA [Myxococcota bacterium]
MTRTGPEEPTNADALQHTLASLGRRWGERAVVRSGQQRPEVLPTGSEALDRALGTGGYPCGRVVEVYGPAASGKTTLALHAVAEVQRRGGNAAFVDVEHALDVAYARALGVDPDALLVSQPDHGEQALDVAEALLRCGAVGIVVVDSVAALVPRAELEGRLGEQRAGLQARLMSQAMRKITAVTARTGAVALFVNQVRHRTAPGFGGQEVTPGGNALKFYASVRLDIRPVGDLERDGAVVGLRSRVRVVKNKLAPPFQTAEVAMSYGRGLCREGELP